MRQIGTLPDEAQAQRFADYLLTVNIRTNIESDSEAWAVWVFEEDQIPLAKTELDTFRENPAAEKYLSASSKADALRQSEQKKQRETKKKVVRAGDAWNQSFLQRCPVTMVLIVLSIGAVMATTSPSKPFNFGNRVEPARIWLTFTPFKPGDKVVEVNKHKYDAILQGQVWRLFTPMFLHFGVLHLLFNMMWLRDLGSAIEVRRGRWTYIALVLSIAAISNFAQAFYSGPNFGGMSGVVFGLFGYVWMQSRFVQNSGFYMPQSIVMLMLIWLFICYTNVLGIPIANTAHTVGLIVGMIAGYAPKLWHDLTH